MPTEFLYFVKLTREKGKIATRVGKADGLAPSFSTLVMLLARESFQHSRVFPSLNNYSPREKLKTTWTLHSDVFNIFATWETVVNIRKGDISKLLRKELQNNWYQCHYSTTSLLTKIKLKRLKRSGVLTIYTNHPGGNPVHKHKTIKFDVVGEQPATEYIKISWTDWNK